MYVMCMCVNICVYVYIYICMYMYLYISMCMCVCMYVYVCMYIYTGIKIAIRHWTLSDNKGYISGTHMSKPDILSCTLSLAVICGKSFKLKLV